MQSSWNLTIRVLFLAFIVGAAAGVLGTALTNNYLAEYTFELGELTEPLRLSEERPRTFPQSYAESVEEVTKSFLPGTVDIFVKEFGSVTIYEPEEAIARGVVLTSDGWLAAVLPRSYTPSQLSLVIGDRAYAINQIVRDSATNVSFLQIEAENLPVVAFGRTDGALPGDQIFTSPQRKSLASAAIVRMDRVGESIRSSDLPSRRLVIDRNESPLGVPATNLAGELIGLMETEAQMIPIELILPSFTSLLREGEILRPTLGVNMIHLSDAAGLSEELRREHAHGALIFGQVPFGSAAAIAGVKSGDIILSVDGQPINDMRSLDDYMLDYASGDAIALTIDRAGETLDLTVTLQ